MPDPPNEKEYAEYLRRVQAELGDTPEGQYAKFGGRLVKRLPREEFVAHYDLYLEIRRTYDETLHHGDTVNDAIVQMLDEHAATLLLKI